MASQNSINDPGVSRSILAVDGETDSETRRVHARTRGTVNAVVVEIVDASGAQVTNFGSSAGLTDAQLRATPVPVSGTVTVDTSALATSAKQDTGNTSVASIDTKTPALGQALAAASVPVILPAATITTLTPPAAITNYASETGGNLAAIKAKTDNIPALGQALAAASVPVVLTAAQLTTLTPPAAITGFATETTLGTIDADTGNIATAVADLPNVIGTDGAAGPTKALSIAGTQATGELQEIQVDADGQLQVDVLTMPTVAVTGTFWQATQPVSAAALPLPSGASTSALQGGGLPAALGASGGLKVDGSGTALPVSGTVTANMGTVTADPFGANADAASATGSISAKLRGIATALGVTALDLGTGTGGTRTLRSFQDTAQWVGGTGVDSTAVQRVSLATNVALPAGTNAIGKLAANSGVDIGDVDITSIAAGTNSIGNVGVIPRTSGGLLIKNCTSGDGSTALTSTAQAIKASAGQLFGWYIFNPNTVTAWVIIYNTASASVTVGTTAPVLVIGVPAGAAANVVNPMGIEFTNAGWSAAAVMTSAAGNTAPTTALDANFFYI